MKKIIDDVDDVVTDSLRGVQAAHPELAVDLEHRIVVRGDAPVAGKVAVISGGGSGHEPLHSGYVGYGMLDAAVSGAVFTSPTPDQIAEAIRRTDSGEGVVQIIKNYTGDVMNFEMAAELAQAEGDTEVASVVVADDVAVEDSLYTAGRRGVGGTVLVERLAGAAAQRGDDLEAVVAVAERVVANVRSMGVALTSCTVPAAGRPTFELPDDEIELGVGIHGEPGRKRIPVAPARDLARDLVEPILADLDFTGVPVIVLLNGMGATPLSELYLLYGDVAEVLGERGIEVARALVGDYITALDMAGASVTLLRADDELLELWDAPVQTPGLRWGR